METYFDRPFRSRVLALHPGMGEEGKFAHSLLDELQSPKGHSQELVKSWLRAVLAEFDVKPTAWAKAAGLAPSTINRFLTSDDVARNLSASTIDKLCRALPSQITDTAHSYWKQKREKAKGHFSIPTALVDVPMIGFVSENSILKADESDIEIRTVSWTDRFRKTLTVPVPTPWISTRLVGFDVDGNSYDPIYPDCSVLICVPIFAMDGPPGPGSKVIIYEKRPSGGFRTYVREVNLDPNGRSWFMPLRGTVSDTQPGLFLYPAQSDPIVLATFWVLSSYHYELPLFGVHKSA